MGRENSLRSRIISLASKRIKKSTWDDDDDLSGNLDAWVLFCFLPGWKQHFVNDIVKSSVFRSSLHFYRLNVKMSSALNFQIWLRIFSRWLSSPNLLPDFRAKTRVENFESKLFWNITQLPRISKRWRALPRPFPTMEKAGNGTKLVAPSHGRMEQRRKAFFWERTFIFHDHSQTRIYNALGFDLILWYIRCCLHHTVLTLVTSEHSFIDRKYIRYT